MPVVASAVEQQYDTPPPTALGAQTYGVGHAFTVPIVHGTGVLLTRNGTPVPQTATIKSFSDACFISCFYLCSNCCSSRSSSPWRQGRRRKEQGRTSGTRQVCMRRVDC